MLRPRMMYRWMVNPERSAEINVTRGLAEAPELDPLDAFDSGSCHYLPVSLLGSFLGHLEKPVTLRNSF